MLGRSRCRLRSSRWPAPMSRATARLGGTPVLREGFVTDNGNLILDVAGLRSSIPDLETRLNQIVRRRHQRALRQPSGRRLPARHVQGVQTPIGRLKQNGNVETFMLPASNYHANLNWSTGMNDHPPKFRPRTGEPAHARPANGRLAEQQVQRRSTGCTRQSAAARRVIRDDERINQMEIEIDALVQSDHRQTPTDGHRPAHGRFGAESHLRTSNASATRRKIARLGISIAKQPAQPEHRTQPHGETPSGCCACRSTASPAWTSAWSPKRCASTNQVNSNTSHRPPVDHLHDGRPAHHHALRSTSVIAKAIERIGDRTQPTSANTSSTWSKGSMSAMPTAEIEAGERRGATD